MENKIRIAMINTTFCKNSEIMQPSVRYDQIFLNSRNLTTQCLKKVPTFELSVTLSNLNRF